MYFFLLLLGHLVPGKCTVEFSFHPIDCVNFICCKRNGLPHHPHHLFDPKHNCLRDSLLRCRSPFTCSTDSITGFQHCNSFWLLDPCKSNLLPRRTADQRWRTGKWSTSQEPLEEFQAQQASMDGKSSKVCDGPIWKCYRLSLLHWSWWCLSLLSWIRWCLSLLNCELHGSHHHHSCDFCDFHCNSVHPLPYCSDPALEPKFSSLGQPQGWNRPKPGWSYDFKQKPVDQNCWPFLIKITTSCNCCNKFVSI